MINAKRKNPNVDRVFPLAPRPFIKRYLYYTKYCVNNKAFFKIFFKPLHMRALFSRNKKSNIWNLSRAMNS